MSSLTFGNFTFDARARRLTQAGEHVHLTAKAIDLLTLLTDRCPDAVAKTEIRARLWPETHVSDVSLTTLIFEVRTALQESARRPRFIRTVHRFGYAFQGDAGPSDRSEAPCCIVYDGREIGLLRGDNLVGRSADCRVRLDSTLVSRHHARISIDGEAVLIEDCGSRNGTWVDGVRTTGRVRLRDGGEVVIAGLRMQFRVLTGGELKTEPYVVGS